MDDNATYYRTRLSGERLRRCYAIAPARVQQYLDAEIAYVQSRIRPMRTVLELGCGYGRVLEHLVQPGRFCLGIDTSLESLLCAEETLATKPGWSVVAMDAARLAFRPGIFDAVVCVQNGICAFRVEPAAVLREALRVARPGGLVLFSSYSAAFWPHRLQWFEAQAAEGLVGEIDREATRPGEIVCKDGFRARSLEAHEFRELCIGFDVSPRVFDVDGSSVFFEVSRSCLA